MSKKSYAKHKRRKKTLRKISSSKRAYGPKSLDSLLIRSDISVYGCWINEDWQMAGMANTIISRRMPAGRILFGVFLVDVIGFGLKDCFGNIAPSESEFHSKVLRRFKNNTGVDLIKIDLLMAQKLIWGGVEYTKRHRFKLPHEFNIWQGIVGELPAGEAIDLSMFGYKDGKPLLIGDMEDIASRMDIDIVDVFEEDDEDDEDD